MKMEKSCGSVIYRKKNNSTEFLLLHYGKGHWGFPKGHVEERESEQETMRRELFEETGLSEIELEPDFREDINYYFKQGKTLIHKDVAFFLARAVIGEVKISHEHSEAKWLSFKEALDLLSFDNARALLKKADSFLQTKTQTANN